jgi:hypothetical protein
MLQQAAAEVAASAAAAAPPSYNAAAAVPPLYNTPPPPPTPSYNAAAVALEQWRHLQPMAPSLEEITNANARWAASGPFKFYAEEDHHNFAFPHSSEPLKFYQESHRELLDGNHLGFDGGQDKADRVELEQCASGSTSPAATTIDQATILLPPRGLSRKACSANTSEGPASSGSRGSSSRSSSVSMGSLIDDSLPISPLGASGRLQSPLANDVAMLQDMLTEKPSEQPSPSQTCTPRSPLHNMVASPLAHKEVVYQPVDVTAQAIQQTGACGAEIAIAGKTIPACDCREFSMEAEEAAARIQAIWRGQQVRKQLEKLHAKPAVEAAPVPLGKSEVAAQVIQKWLIYIHPEEELAAQVIQKWVRRQQAEKRKDIAMCMHSKVPTELGCSMNSVQSSSQQQAAAACKIQACERGRQARMEVQHLRSSASAQAEGHEVVGAQSALSMNEAETAACSQSSVMVEVLHQPEYATATSAAAAAADDADDDADADDGVTAEDSAAPMAKSSSTGGAKKNSALKRVRNLFSAVRRFRKGSRK